MGKHRDTLKQIETYTRKTRTRIRTIKCNRMHVCSLLATQMIERHQNNGNSWTFFLFSTQQHRNSGRQTFEKHFQVHSALYNKTHTRTHTRCNVWMRFVTSDHVNFSNWIGFSIYMYVCVCCVYIPNKYTCHSRMRNWSLCATYMFVQCNRENNQCKIPKYSHFLCVDVVSKYNDWPIPIHSNSFAKGKKNDENEALCHQIWHF